MGYFGYVGGNPLVAVDASGEMLCRFASERGPSNCVGSLEERRRGLQACAVGDIACLFMNSNVQVPWWFGGAIAGAPFPGAARNLGLCTGLEAEAHHCDDAPAFSVPLSDRRGLCGAWGDALFSGDVAALNAAVLRIAEACTVHFNLFPPPGTARFCVPRFSASCEDTSIPPKIVCRAITGCS